MEYENILVDMYSKLKTNHEFVLGPVDTDSISICNQDGSLISTEQQEELLREINSMLPEFIVFANDGYYDKIIILRAKNYILKQGDKITKKGSSLKSSKIEPRLKAFMSEIIDCLLTDNKDSIIDVYNKYVYEVNNLKDISGWCSKKTITDSVLNPERTTEQKILDSLNGQQVQMGDKIYVYFAEVKTNVEVPKYKKNKATGLKEIVGYVAKEVIDNPLVLKENWSTDMPNHSVDKLLKRIHDTLTIFENVITIEEYPRYYLKNKEVKELLRKVTHESHI